MKYAVEIKAHIAPKENTCHWVNNVTCLYFNKHCCEQNELITCTTNEFREIIQEKRHTLCHKKKKETCCLINEGHLEIKHHKMLHRT